MRLYFIVTAIVYCDFVNPGFLSPTAVCGDVQLLQQERVCFYRRNAAEATDGSHGRQLGQGELVHQRSQVGVVATAQRSSLGGAEVGTVSHR